MQKSIALSKILGTLRERVILVQVKMRKHREYRVQLGMQNPSLSNIRIRIMILVNFLSKVSNSHLDCPLEITQKWTKMNCFQSDICKQMDALPDEMNAVSATLIIQFLKFTCEVAE